MTKLEMLIDLYGYHRQEGHTTAMVDGAETSKAVVIVANNTHRGHFMQNHKDVKQVIPLSEIENLRGYRGPILVDHYALQCAFWDHEEQKKQEMLARSQTVK